MKSQGLQIMSIFINKAFYHCSLFCIAKTDSAPVRTRDLLGQVLVTHRKSWHQASNFTAWMKSLSSPPPPCSCYFGPLIPPLPVAEKPSCFWEIPAPAVKLGPLAKVPQCMMPCGVVAGTHHQPAGALTFDYADLMTPSGMLDPRRLKWKKKHPNIKCIYIYFHLRVG